MGEDPPLLVHAVLADLLPVDVIAVRVLEKTVELDDHTELGPAQVQEPGASADVNPVLKDRRVGLVLTACGLAGASLLTPGPVVKRSSVDLFRCSAGGSRAGTGRAGSVDPWARVRTQEIWFRC